MMTNKERCKVSVREGFLGKGYDVTWGCGGEGTIGVKHFKKKSDAKTHQKVLLKKFHHKNVIWKKG